MAELPRLKGRIIHKHATAAVWNNINFTPLQSEIVVYDPGYDSTDGKTYSWERFKIGDGSHTIQELPFVDETFVNRYVTKEGDSTIVGNLSINGNLTVSGGTIESNLENVVTPQNTITLRNEATVSLLDGEYTGIIAENYDGDSTGMLVFDNTGTAYVGDEGDIQPLATRDAAEAFIDGNIVIWDAENSRLVDGGKKSSNIVGQLGDGIHAEVFNDYINNVATGNYSTAKGTSTRAGGYGFTFNTEHYFDEELNKLDVSDDVDPEDSTKGRFYLTTVDGIEVGLEYSVQLSNNFDFNGFVEEVNAEENWIKVTNFILPNSSTTGSGIYEDTVLWFPNKPSIGDRIIGEATSVEGFGAVALQDYSHAEGRDTIASGKYSHAEGRLTRAAYGAHAEGYKSKADAYCSHAEGATTLADEMYAHAEGSTTKALGISSHAEGDNTEASGRCSHAQGSFSKATGFASHAGGATSRANADYAYAFGVHAVANKPSEYVIGRHNVVDYSSNGWGRLFVVGNGTDSSNRSDAFTVYDDGRAAVGAIEPVNDNDVISNKYFQDTLLETFKYYKNWEDTENYISTSLEPYNVWENTKTYIETADSIKLDEAKVYAEGLDVEVLSNAKKYTDTSLNNLKTLGSNSIQWITDPSYSIGINNNMAGDKGCVTIGYNNTVSVRDENRNILPGEGSTSIGCGSKVTAAKAYALGSYCVASASGAVAIGQSSKANGSASFAGGYNAIADGRNSIAIGRLTKASADYQTVLGRANVPVTSSKAVLVVGTGMQDTQRSNGMILWEDGRLEIGADPTADMEVATKRYVDSRPTSDIGKKSESKGSELFNDYENLTVLGEYASAHGKGTSKYDAEKESSKIYYKAMSGTTKHVVEEYWDYDLALDYNYYSGNYEGLIEVSNSPENAYIILSLVFEDPEAEYGYRVIEQSLKLTNGQCKINLADYRKLGVTELYISGIEDNTGKELPLLYSTYRKFEYYNYNFEDYLFTTNSAAANNEVEKVYRYIDTWGNTRYTLNPDWYPEGASSYEVNDWVKVEEVYNTKTDFWVSAGEEYRLVLIPEFIASSGYTALKEYGIQGWTDDYYTGNSYYEDLSDITNVVELSRAGYSPHPAHYSADFELFYGDYVGHVGTLYKYISTVPVEEVPADDPIHKTIAYEAIKNGGAKFSLTNGTASTTFGNDAVTNGQGAFASGVNSLATANYTVSIGKDTLARGIGAIAFGLEGKATGMYSFAVNEKGIASGYASAVFGDHCVSTNYYSFSGGYKTASHGSSAMAFGAMSTANGTNSLSFGDQTVTNGRNSIAFGFKSIANGMNSFTAGYNNQANGENSIALGMLNIVDGKGAAIGENNNITTNSYAYGRNNQVSGANGSVGLGNKNIVTANNGAVAIGENNKVTAPESAYALGVQCEVTQRGAVAIGNMAKAQGSSSVAIGYNANAIGSNSVAIGRWAKASGDYQTVLGRANIAFDKEAVLIVGIGMQDNQRANGLVVWEDGRVEVGADPIGSMEVVTKRYLDSKLGDINTTLLNIIAQQEAIIAKQNELLGGNA